MLDGVLGLLVGELTAVLVVDGKDDVTSLEFSLCRTIGEHLRGTYTIIRNKSKQNILLMSYITAGWRTHEGDTRSSGTSLTFIINLVPIITGEKGVGYKICKYRPYQM